MIKLGPTHNLTTLQAYTAMNLTRSNFDHMRNRGLIPEPSGKQQKPSGNNGTQINTWTEEEIAKATVKVNNFRFGLRKPETKKPKKVDLFNQLMGRM